MFGRRRREVLEEELRITREVIRRNELAFRDGSHLTRELVQAVTELIQSVKDIREETRAQTRAILTVLDRLENGGAGAQ